MLFISQKRGGGGGGGGGGGRGEGKGNTNLQNQCPLLDVLFWAAAHTHH